MWSSIHIKAYFIIQDFLLVFHCHPAVTDSIIKGIHCVLSYFDDILITGTTNAEHVKTLEEVLSRLQRAGLRAKRNKCEFMVPSVMYLGH